VWSSSSDPKRVVDAAATSTARADWQKKKEEAEAKGETFTEKEPEEARRSRASALRTKRTRRASVSPLWRSRFTPAAQVVKTEYETNWGWKVQNDNKPIWVRNPKDVEKESYNEFFKSTFKCVCDASRRQSATPAHRAAAGAQGVPGPRGAHALQH
jgi:heat shock protein beta